ncbi:MAG: AI-2E family transporter [Nanoarchaeota archaeon]
METSFELKKHSKYFFIASFIVILLVSIILAWPFVGAIFGAIVLAYLFYPVYNFVLKIIRNETISALITSITVIVILIFPILFIGNAVFNEAADLFIQVKNINFAEIEEKYLSTLFGEKLSENIGLSGSIKEALDRLTTALLQKTGEFIFTLHEKILQLFVTFFITFYLFKDGRGLLFSIKEALPLKRKYKNEIADKFNDTIYATIYGVVLTAIVQGIVGGIGLWIFNVSSPILWTLVMIILSMLPFIGAAFVWLPAAIIKLATGDAVNGVGLLLYGLLIVSTIDNIIRPKIIGSRSKVHPALILIGVLGGIKLFGIVGIIIGPLILSILTVFFEIYTSEEFQE